MFYFMKHKLEIEFVNEDNETTVSTLKINIWFSNVINEMDISN